MKTLIYLFMISLLLHSQSPAQANQKNRVNILTDIGADPDDSESMVRLLLYSNEIDIEGIVAAISCWQKTIIHPEYIKSIVQAFGKIQPNLNKHEAGYHPAETLLTKIKNGLAEYGMEGVGEGKDSPGSKWILKVLEEKDKRPLWICVWGGVNSSCLHYRLCTRRKFSDGVCGLIASSL